MDAIGKILGLVGGNAMGMSSVAGITKDYFDTLKSARDGKLKPKVVLVQICLPVAIGVAAAAVRFCVPNSEELVTGVSIVAALMCGVATLLFQTRVDLRQRFEAESDAFLVEGDLKLVDELFAQVMWAILSGFLLAFFLVLKGALAPALGCLELLARVGYGLVWGFAANFVLTVGVVLKRMRCVYEIVAVHSHSRK